MAGNRRAYGVAMQRAGNFAWEKKWSRAIQEYNRALSEFPEDVTALTGLGLAYAETRQLSKALEMYQQAANHSPDNPEVIRRVGHTLERLAQWPAAAQAYVRAADACLRMRDIPQATELLSKAAILDPENLLAHRNLVKVYQGRGQVHKAARHLLIMARVLTRQKRSGPAMEQCKTALQLDPHNVEARGILDALTQGVALPDGPTARLQPDADGKRTLDSFVVFDDIDTVTAPLLSAAKRASPADMVRERSLAQMAEAAFSDDADPRTMQTNLLLAQAADFQTRGLIDKAVSAYADAIQAGVDTPAVRFNLGLLYCEKREFARAAEFLSQSMADPKYALGARFALGECYRAWGKTAEAAQHLLEVLRIVDSQIVPEGQVGELNAIYEQLARKQAGQNGSEETQRFIESAVSLLSNKGWGQHVFQVRKQLDSLAGGGMLIALAETLAEPEAEMATEAIGQIQDYLKHKMTFTALEECYWAMHHAPYFLPLHLRMTDILIQEGRLDEAVQKFITIAETYKVRGDLERAIAAYRKALDLAPMDVEVRERLIRLLIDVRRIDAAIEQYIAVADAYYQLAQVSQTVEKLTEALTYTSRGDPARNWEVNVLHRIGDIFMQRLDWRQAIKAYRRLKRADAEDVRARSYLIDLHFKAGQRDQALREVDELIEFYMTLRQPRKLLSTLQDAVHSRPEELALRMRLAKTYLDMKMKEEAIGELNTVGEIQLNRGMTQDAIRTVRAVIRLGPDDPQAYQQLLAQLKGQ